MPVTPVDRHALRAPPVEFTRGVARAMVVHFYKIGKLRDELVLYARTLFAIAAQERRHGFGFRFVAVYDHAEPLSS